MKNSELSDLSMGEIEKQQTEADTQVDLQDRDSEDSPLIMLCRKENTEPSSVQLRNKFANLGLESIVQEK